MSDQIWLQRVIGGRKGFDGFWMCPTPNCDGAGFGFDIYPTDPSHPANEGWTTFDDDEEEFLDDDEDADQFDDNMDTPWSNIEEPAEYDPAEPSYKDRPHDPFDMEGEEWKYGLEPGQTLSSTGQSAFDSIEEACEYDQPDERPRFLDWSNRPESKNDSFTDDDIPF